MDHKKNAYTIMAKRHPKDGTQESSPMAPEIAKDEEGQIDERHSAAEDIFMALHEKSPGKLAQALANFYDIHEMMSEAQESEE
jgi:hypothetical protein